MIRTDQAAWIVAEYVKGRAQTQIAAELGVEPTLICLAIVRFCAEMGYPVQFRYYREERLNAACAALRRYLANGGSLSKTSSRKLDEAFALARGEHAWLLRAEGLTLQQIGKRLGVGTGRAHQMVHKFARRVVRATRKTRWHYEVMR